MKLWCILLLGLWTGAAVAEEVPWQTTSLAKDGSGQIWSVLSMPLARARSRTPEFLRQLGVFVPSTSSWKVHPCPTISNEGRPEAVATLTCGKVACLWHDGAHSVLTLHQDGKDSRWCSLDTTFTAPRLLPLSDGGLVITEGGPQLARIPASGASPVLTHIPEELVVGRRAAGPRGHPQSMEVDAVECGDGSICLWSYSLGRLFGVKQIPGLMRWSGEEISPVKDLPIKARTPISVVVADGKEHVLAAVMGVGLMRLHWPDGKGGPFGTPDAEFSCIEKMAFVDGILHVVTCPEPDDGIGSGPTQPVQGGMPTSISDSMNLRRHYQTGGRTGNLWRIDGTKPQRLIKGLDVRPTFGWRDRPLFSTGHGLMVGAMDGGPWWRPSVTGSKPFLFDRSQGYTLGCLATMVSIGDGRFLARATDSSWTIVPPPGDQPRASSTRMKTLYTKRSALQDSRLHLWAFRVSEGDFAEWDGRSWHSHNTPKELADIAETDFAADTHDHGWLIPVDSGKTAVVDLATGTWHLFDSLEQAVAEKLVPGDRVIPHENDERSLVSHTSGGKGFVDKNKVHVFQNGKWISTALTEFGTDLHLINNAPWFDAAGVFNFELNNQPFRLGQDGKWLKVSPSMDSLTPPTSGHNRSPLPADCHVPRVRAAYYDHSGTAWLPSMDGKLWKYLDGVSVQISDQDGSEPMRSQDDFLTGVIVDPVGNAFLQHFAWRSLILRYDVIAARPPPSVAPATLASNEPGTAVIHLPAAKGIRNRWRLDQADWHKLVQDADLKLEALPGGAHQVEIKTFDDELTQVGESQTLAFTIQAAGPEQYARQIHQLASADLNAREAAARVLKAHGKAALPALKQALADPGADATQQWWLRAIIQHIEGR